MSPFLCWRGSWWFKTPFFVNGFWKLTICLVKCRLSRLLCILLLSCLCCLCRICSLFLNSRWCNRSSSWLSRSCICSWLCLIRGHISFIYFLVKLTLWCIFISSILLILAFTCCRFARSTLFNWRLLTRSCCYNILLWRCTLSIGWTFRWIFCYRALPTSFLFLTQ